MGCNYYARPDPCAHCGRSDKNIHIGKSSIGWVFYFRGYREAYDEPEIHSFEDWKHFISTSCNGVVWDEYGKKKTLEWFVKFVEAKQKDGRRHELQIRDPYYSERNWVDKDGYDFCDYKFC